MKKFFFLILISLVIVIGILGIIAPREYIVEKRLVMNRPVEVVFFGLKHFKAHTAWSPWTSKDKNIKYEYTGEDGTVGFKVKWDGNNDVGRGTQLIREIVENEKIVTDVHFIRPIDDRSTSYFLTKEMYDHQTEVTWGMKGKLGFPRNVFFYIFKIPTKLGYYFDEGLRVFKAIIEEESEEEKALRLKKEKEEIKGSIDEIGEELKK